MWLRLQFLIAPFVLSCAMSLAGEPTPLPATPPPAVAPTPAPAPTADKLPAPPVPADPATLTPQSEIANGGIAFGPRSAMALTEAMKKKQGKKNTLLVIGPGAPAKGMKVTGWTSLAPGKLAAPEIGPSEMLRSLPEILAKQSPEVVVLVGDSATTRKLTNFEADDWEDAARLCLHAGAVPILAAPPVTGTNEKDGVANAMARAMEAVSAPGMAQTPEQLPDRSAKVLLLLEKHVFARKPIAVKGAGKAGPEDE